MEKSFDLEIITPNKTLYKGRAVSLVAPAEFGYLGVLADHAPLVANLVAGRISVRRESREGLVFDLKNRGFLQVVKNNVILILEADG